MFEITENFPSDLLLVFRPLGKPSLPSLVLESSNAFPFRGSE